MVLGGCGGCGGFGGGLAEKKTVDRRIIKFWDGSWGSLQRYRYERCHLIYSISFPIHFVLWWEGRSVTKYMEKRACVHNLEELPYKEHKRCVGFLPGSKTKQYKFLQGSVI